MRDFEPRLGRIRRAEQPLSLVTAGARSLALLRKMSTMKGAVQSGKNGVPFCHPLDNVRKFVRAKVGGTADGAVHHPSCQGVERPAAEFVAKKLVRDRTFVANVRATWRKVEKSEKEGTCTLGGLFLPWIPM